MYTCKDTQTGTQTRKLTGAHTGIHMPKSTLVGRQDTSSYRNTCMLTQAYGHPETGPPTDCYTRAVHTWAPTRAHTSAEEDVHP